MAKQRFVLVDVVLVELSILLLNKILKLFQASLRAHHCEVEEKNGRISQNFN
jgi:hypothetical protein